MQLEIPMAVRKRLFRDDELRGRFRELINKLYYKVIVPDYKEGKRKLRVSEEIGKSFIPTKTIKGEKEREEVYQQVLRYETKEEANPNQKKNI